MNTLSQRLDAAVADDKHGHIPDDATIEIEAGAGLVREAARAVAQLSTYASHTPGCRMREQMDRCTCGVAELLGRLGIA